jgi:divalent metal cation (Fe/Co/Zn/Cd) transporter
LYAERRDGSKEGAERTEAVASPTARILLLALAVYMLAESLSKLLGSGPRPVESRLGIAVTFFSLVAMPILGRAKLKCAKALGSAALRSDAYETTACAWLSATTLTGLAANAVFGWWWADPVAALVLVPLIVREALEGLRGAHDE